MMTISRTLVPHSLQPKTRPMGPIGQPRRVAGPVRPVAKRPMTMMPARKRNYSY